MLKSKIVCQNCHYEKLVPSEKYMHKVHLKCPKCNKVIAYHKNIHFEQPSVFPEIQADDFIHELDRRALKALQGIPGVGKLTKVMMKYSYEKIVRVNELADNIEVTQKTCGYIFEMAIRASNILGVQLPRVYINQDPIPNAYTTCVEDPIIVFSSGIIDLCDDEELFAVIAHEMGHIKCEHVLYHMLADFVALFPNLLGVTKLLTSSLNLALYEWSRKSELSADRAAVIVTGNKEKVISLLMKLAGGSSKLMNMIDYDDFVSQYSQWEKLMEKFTDRMIQRLWTLGRTHPFPIVRAHEITEWPGLTQN